MFEYGTRAPLGWEAFKELELQFSLDELSTYAEGLELMRLISGANSLGQNPLLSAQWHGWELLVSAASVLKMIAAPTERVVNVICDPRQGFVRLNTKRSTSDVVVLTAIDELMLWRPTPRELECLAFWLATPGLRRRFQSTYVSLQEGTQIELPRVPGQISLRADGITDGNRLLISDFRLSWAYTRATWPRTWSKVILEDIVGCDSFSVSAGSVTERLCNHECLRARSLQRLGRTSFDHQYKNYLRRYRPRLVNPVELHYS